MPDKITYRGTNSQGNSYDNRVDSSGNTGYHYSNTNDSYYYKNTNGSTYYNSGEPQRHMLYPDTDRQRLLEVHLGVWQHHREVHLGRWLGWLGQGLG
ncbi:hypothetical protein VHUM_01485 [Vanrija humicola]|uniref:Uncharacterized protein n=1 Tax=Vanrija humicola TaxID=5417 RepID=A0A7D8V0S8_VANHU|nr:hypothetical protein VHUM_01485 [Vanrija humicola]